MSVTEQVMNVLKQYPNGISLDDLAKTVMLSRSAVYSNISRLRRHRGWPIRMINGLYTLEGPIPGNGAKSATANSREDSRLRDKQKKLLDLLNSRPEGVPFEELQKLMEYGTKGTMCAAISDVRGKGYRIDQVEGKYVYVGPSSEFGISVSKVRGRASIPIHGRTSPMNQMGLKVIKPKVKRQPINIINTLEQLNSEGLVEESSDFIVIDLDRAREVIKFLPGQYQEDFDKFVKKAKAYNEVLKGALSLLDAQKKLIDKLPL